MTRNPLPIVAFALCATLFFSTLTWADAQSSFDEGLRYYREGKIPEAITAWEHVLRIGETSGPLLYNLANAYYRQGQIGKSILYYERARRLIPRDRDVDSNLDLVRLATVDKIESPLRLVIWNWIDSVRDRFSLPELAWGLQLAGLLAAGIIAIGRFGPASFRQYARIPMFVFLGLFLIIGSWYVWRASLDSRRFAIILAEKTEVHSAPDAGSQELFSLHEGTKVRCGERLSDWIAVRLADGRKGWIPVSDLERI